MTTSTDTSLDDDSIVDVFLAEFHERQLSEVVFVMDYMQLVFHDRRLTLNVWPTLVVDGQEHDFAWIGYEKALHNLIGHGVTSSTIVNRPRGFSFTLGFAEVRITPSIGDLVGPEILAFSADTRGTYAVWREGDPPFDCLEP